MSGEMGENGERGPGRPRREEPHERENRLDDDLGDTLPDADLFPVGGPAGPMADPIRDLPPEEHRDAPHEVIRDWRGEFPLRGG